MDRCYKLNMGSPQSLLYLIGLTLQRLWIPFHRYVVERETEKFYELLGRGIGGC